jgi:PAS domain S-box-containing protein
VVTLLGHEPSELVGGTLDDRLHPDEREQAVARLRDEARTESSVTHEFRLCRADGIWRTFEAALSDLLHDPAVGGLVLTARDVSDRRALEDQLTRQAFTTLSRASLTGAARRQVKHALGARRGRTPTSPSCSST